jgi:hypothetical protein
MYCKSCRSEYRSGIERCSDCGAELLPGDLPDPPDLRLKEPPPDPVTVFTSRDPALLPVVRSILESEEVPFFVRGEELQDLFGIGRLGLGFNPIVGPIEIQVQAADAERARELLAEIEPSETDTETEAESETEELNADADPYAVSRANDGVPTVRPVASPRARRGFRLLVLAYLALVVRQWTMNPRWWREFPETLWEQVEAYFRPSDLTRTIDSLVSLELPAAFVISVGLLTFSPLARQLYVALWAWTFVSYALGGPGLGYGFGSSLGLLTDLGGGAILALAFYGPIAEVFTEKKAARHRRRRSPATSPG